MSHFYDKLLEEFELEKSYVLDNGVSVPVLKYKGQVVFKDGRYMSNRAGFCCLSYYRNSELPWEEQFQYYNSALREIRNIDKEEERLEKEAIELKSALIEERLKREALIKEVEEKIAKISFKYDGARHLMILEGKLYVNNPLLIGEEPIEVNEGNVREIKRFLDDRWEPSEATLKKWESYRIPNENVQKILNQHNQHK